MAWFSHPQIKAVWQMHTHFILIPILRLGCYSLTQICCHSDGKQSIISATSLSRSVSPCDINCLICTFHQGAYLVKKLVSTWLAYTMITVLLWSVLRLLTVTQWSPRTFKIWTNFHWFYHFWAASSFKNTDWSPPNLDMPWTKEPERVQYVHPIAKAWA